MIKKLDSDKLKLMFETSQTATYIRVPEALPIRLVRSMRGEWCGCSIKVSLLPFCPQIPMVFP